MHWCRTYWRPKIKTLLNEEKIRFNLLLAIKHIFLLRLQRKMTTSVVFRKFPGLYRGWLTEAGGFSIMLSKCYNSIISERKHQACPRVWRNFEREDAWADLKGWRGFRLTKICNKKNGQKKIMNQYVVSTAEIVCQGTVRGQPGKADRLHGTWGLMHVQRSWALFYSNKKPLLFVFEIFFPKTLWKTSWHEKI